MFSLKTFLKLFILLIAIFFLIGNVISNVDIGSDLYSINTDGTNLKRVTTFFDGFDGFPVFSPNIKYLVFASNRNQLKKSDTKLFIAEKKN